MESAPWPSCPLCAGGAQPAFMAGEHRMYRCRACHTAFLSPVPTPAELERFYARFHLSDSEGGWYDQMEQRMQADFPEKVRLIRRATSGRDPRRLIDVGCGKGFFVKACSDAGIRAMGIDLSLSGVEYAKRILGVKAVCGNLSQLKGTLGTFDTATLWATIEHVPEPVQLLRDIFDVLEPGGVLLLDTGIGHDWLDRLLPGVNQWYDPPQHLWVFSREGLEKALMSAGFSVESVDPCFERSGLRRALRIARNGVLAAGLRVAATLGGMSIGPFGFTRYPLGNLMSAIARKPSR